MNIYLSTNRFLLFLLCSTFLYTFISISELPWTLYMLSLAFCVLVLYLYILLNLDIVLMKQYRLINALITVFGVTNLASIYLNGMMSSYALLNFFLTVVIFPFIEIQREKGHVRFLYKVIAFWLGLLVFANDVLMVIMPGRFYGDGISDRFLLGNKFGASYDHITLLLMTCILFECNAVARKFLPLLFAVTFFICYYMDCKTAAIGTTIFLVVSYAPKNIQNLLYRKTTALLVIAACALFIYYINIFRLPPIKYFITEILMRDVTLTGRAPIYEILPGIIRSHPWIGYGSSSEIIYKYTGAYNAQNGFFDLVMCYGFPSALIFVVMLISLIRGGTSSAARYLLGAIYCYLIMSTIEVTFTTTLLLFGVLLFTDIDTYREEPVTIIDWKG